MPNFASLSCFYSKLRWGGAFLPPLGQNRVPEYPVQNRVKGQPHKVPEVSHKLYHSLW